MATGQKGPAESRPKGPGDGPAHEARPLELGEAVVPDAEGFGEESSQPDDEQRAEDQRILRLGLDADAVGPLDVSPSDGPQQTGYVGQAEDFEGGRVGLVGPTVEELEARRGDVVDLEGDGP